MRILYDEAPYGDETSLFDDKAGFKNAYLRCITCKRKLRILSKVGFYNGTPLMCNLPVARRSGASVFILAIWKRVRLIQGCNVRTIIPEKKGRIQED